MSLILKLLVVEDEIGLSDFLFARADFSGFHRTHKRCIKILILKVWAGIFDKLSLGG